MLYSLRLSLFPTLLMLRGERGEGRDCSRCDTWCDSSIARVESVPNPGIDTAVRLSLSSASAFNYEKALKGRVEWLTRGMILKPRRKVAPAHEYYNMNLVP